MIDEELYQQATDELNSERRRPHLWARACALASDDHDEARYLYTNLRVEELLAERDNAPANNNVNNNTSEPMGSVSDLALEPVETEKPDSLDEAFGSATPDSADEPAIESVRPGVTRNVLDSVDLAAPTGTVEASDEASPSSVKTALKLDLDNDSTLDLDPEDIAQINRADTERQAASAAQAAPSPSDLIRDQLAGSMAHNTDMDDTSPGGRPTAAPISEPGAEASRDELSWLDDVESKASRGEPASARVFDDEAASELDASLAGLTAPIVSTQDLLKEPQTPARTDNQAAFGSGIRDDYADSRDLDDLLDGDTDDDELDEEELITGRGGLWAVYETGSGALKPVRRGVSWSALFLTLPWLLFRGLIGTAIVYTLLWAVAIGGLLMTGLWWLDAGPAASDMLKLACLGFAAVAVIGLILIPFLRANRWREKRFKRRGYMMLAKVRARNADEAVGRVRRYAM